MNGLNSSFDARDVSPTSEWQAYSAAYNFQGASSDSSTLHNPAQPCHILEHPKCPALQNDSRFVLDDSAKGLRFGGGIHTPHKRHFYQRLWG
jgi:hypothetical protein